MLPRALLVLLVVLNLGVAAWWWSHEPAAAVAGGVAPGVPRLQLPSERPAATVAPAVAATEQPGRPAAALPADAVCASLGPFADVAAARAAQARLPAGVLHSRVVERSVGRVRGWRVLAPPLASADEAEALAARIAAAGFSDYFVMREGADANAVALGRYQSGQAARRRADALVAAGFGTVRAEPLGGVRQSWLDAAFAAAADVAAARTASGAAQVQPAGCDALR